MGVRFLSALLRINMNEKEKDAKVKGKQTNTPENRQRLLHLAGLERESSPKRWIESLKEEIEKLR